MKIVNRFVVGMSLWEHWWVMVADLRSAFHRTRTFYWFVMVIAGYTVRGDLAGVSSLMRSLGLNDFCYDRLLDFFHSKGVCPDVLARRWVMTVLSRMPGILTHNGSLLVVGDGIKVAKSGRKMPAVKSLHQESESNTKPSFIMGHSAQALCLLVGSLGTVFALPLICRIHEGVIFSNRDRSTLLDKIIRMLHVLNLSLPVYLLADAYYASGALIKSLRKNGHHLITRVRSNAVAFEPIVTHSKRRGRRKKYGTKIKLRSIWSQSNLFVSSPSPLPGEEKVVVRIYSQKLLWKSAGQLVLFVWVDHPLRGRIILMTSDLELLPLDLLRLYALRFKIEVSFKQSLHTLGAYAYHFWMKAMKPIARFSKGQHLHHQTEQYRQKVRRKINAYHLHIQCGLIAQGLLQSLSVTQPAAVWRHFGSWIRTIRPNTLPSEAVTAAALRNTLPEFFAVCSKDPIHAKFIHQTADPERSRLLQLAA